MTELLNDPLDLQVTVAIYTRSFFELSKDLAEILLASGQNVLYDLYRPDVLLKRRRTHFTKIWETS